MKNILLFFFFIPTISFAQISNEIPKTDLQKITTKGHPKSMGLDINISYPADWSYTSGKRPHVLFRLNSNDKMIGSVFSIKDILESATKEQREVFKILGRKEIENLIAENIFPNSKNCSEFFADSGLENIKNPTCRNTKIEGLTSSVASSYGTIKRAELVIDSYWIYYQVVYGTKIIVITFDYQNVKNEQERFLSDNLANKIMNSVVINNLWKK